jgi:hypothetical protein
MRWVEYEEFEPGDKVKLNDEIWEYWYKNIKNFKVKKGEILIVEFQDGRDVWTNKGIFEFDELELVEE